jgi:hypothetical protein
MRKGFRDTICFFVVALSLVSTGCGSVSVDFYTKVDPSGDYNQQISVTATGILGEQLITQNLTQSATNNGWTATAGRNGDSATFNASKQFHSGDKSTVFDAMGDNASIKLGDINSRISNGFFYKDYYFEGTIPSNPINPDANNTAMADALLNSMFKMSWTIELPGKIVETNADTHTGNAATWNLTYSSVTKGTPMMIHTRILQWGNIGIAGGAGIAVILLLVLFIRKKRPAPAVQSSETKESP